MPQSNIYRISVLDRLNLEKKPLISAKCLSFNIRRDSLKKTNSSFFLDKTQSGLKEGDVLVLYDSYGTKLFYGVINRVDGKSIDCNQIESLFNDLWKYNVINQSSLESTLKKIIEDDFISNSDPLISDLFSVFTVNTISTTNENLPSKECDYIKNFESFIYSMFNKYFIRFHFDLPLNGTNPKIDIGKKSLPRIKIANNNNATRNISPLTEIFETNKLIIYSSVGEYRETWYTSNNGITNNPNELTRLTIVKTKIVFSDEEINLIKAQNIRNEIYNHKIDIELVLNNCLYNFFEFELGQEFSVWMNGSYFDTILTGYELNKNMNGFLEVVKLTFGKVRTKLEDKWQVTEDD